MEIKIVMNSGGMITDVLASPELAGAEVEIIDYCTDDPDEYDKAEESWQEAKEQWRKGELTSIY